MDRGDPTEARNLWSVICPVERIQSCGGWGAYNRVHRERFADFVEQELSDQCNYDRTGIYHEFMRLLKEDMDHYKNTKSVVSSILSRLVRSERVEKLAPRGQAMAIAAPTAKNIYKNTFVTGN